MRSNTRVSYRLLWTVLITVLWLSGCSSSSEADTNAESDSLPADSLPIDSGIATDANNVDTTPANDDPITSPSVLSPTTPEQTPGEGAPSLTRVDFDITVPVYFSNALQVRLIWGETDTNANWIVGQSWAVSMELPTNTEHPLSVTFSDDNGGTPLGTFETQFKTGSATAETYSITADQFDTDRWDDDADGISNLDEGNVADITQPVPVTVELIRDKTFRIRWEQNAAADYYRVLENPDGVSGFTPITENLSATTNFFDHRVALHKRTNARYMVEACDATGCTNSVQHLIEGSLEEAIGYFKASNAEKNDYFGSDVSLSDDGNTLAVSASSEDSAATGINGNQTDNSSIDAGAVYIFQRINGSWVQQAYLKASNPDTLDEFGYSLSLSADGNTLAVGAVGEASDANGVNGDQSDNSVPKSGAVYVFSRTGTQWQQVAYIKASNSDENDWFGYNVRLSSDAKTLAVSAIDEDSSATGINGDESNNDHYRAGAVYVFESVNEEWEQQAYIKGEVAYLNDRFGLGLDLSGDGNTIAIGVYDDSLATDRSLDTRGADYNTYWGAVYVYVRRGVSWEKEAFLRANSDYWNNFGLSVRLSEDGNLLAASANNSLMVFKRSGGVWTNEAQLFGSNSAPSDRFGDLFSLSADGSTIAVGAFEEDSASTGLNGYEGDEVSEENSGAAYVFTQDAGVWTQQAYVKASNTQRWTFFGTALALNANGDTLAIASDRERSSSSGINGAQITEETATTAGAVYLY